MIRLTSLHLWLSSLLFPLGMLCALPGLTQTLGADHLQPVFRMPAENGKQVLSTRRQYGFDERKAEGVAFHAVLTNTWLPGLVPLFAFEKPGLFELRRRPPSGQENITEPLFFALPPEHEPDAAAIAGTWSAEATRANGSLAILGWELGVDGEKIIGRFDPNSEYRFGFITGGTWKSNQLELQVEYNMDRYLLSGILREGRFRGTWEHLNGDESGTWKAWRALAPLEPQQGRIVPLRMASGKRRSPGLLSARPPPRPRLDPLPAPPLPHLGG